MDILKRFFRWLSRKNKEATTNLNKSINVVEKLSKELEILKHGTATLKIMNEDKDQNSVHNSLCELKMMIKVYELNYGVNEELKECYNINNRYYKRKYDIHGGL